MRRRAFAWLLVAACGKHQASPAARPVDVVHLAAARDPKLIPAAQGGDPAVIAALGGAGGEAAISELRKLLPRAEAVRALWYADAKEAAADVARAYDGTRAEVVRALGHIGGTSELPVLQRALSDIPDEALISLGLLGRRKVAWGDDLRKAVAAGPGGASAWTLAYALDGEADPQPAADEVVLLSRLAADGDWRARSIAVRALGKRGKMLPAALDDPHVWVRVEAVRALAGPTSTPDSRGKVAGWAADEWGAIGDTEERLTSERIHPVLEALTLLRSHAEEAPVAAAFQKIYDFTSLAGSTEVARYTPGMRRSIDAVNCAAAAGLGVDKVTSCGEPNPDAWTKRTRAVLALQVADGAAVARLSQAHEDSEVVQAALVEALVRTGDPEAQKLAEAALRGAGELQAASAADALVAKYRTGMPPWAIDALGARLKRESSGEGDPEFVIGHLGAIEAAGPSAAAAVPELEPFLTDPNQSVRAAARKALTAATGKDPGPGAPRGLMKVPPVDPNAASAPHTLRVKTTKGEFRIETGGSTWNVATVVELSRKGFYDGTTIHRVVPDFVVQGGDPTATGSGGPGFDVIAEPSDVRYERGTVGIADSGKDTGGSQFFVTLSPAPHLEGRYTVIGHVPLEDMAVVDRLLVGDRILQIKVEK